MRGDGIQPRVGQPARSRTYESMHTLQWGHWRVRVWRAEDEPRIAREPNPDLVLAAGPCISPEEVMVKLSELRDVAAVELVNSDGDGGLVYVNWP